MVFVCAKKYHVKRCYPLVLKTVANMTRPGVGKLSGEHSTLYWNMVNLGVTTQFPVGENSLFL